VKHQVTVMGCQAVAGQKGRAAEVMDWGCLVVVIMMGFPVQVQHQVTVMVLVMG
jgi:hypothetical protein